MVVVAGESFSGAQLLMGERALGPMLVWWAAAAGCVLVTAIVTAILIGRSDDHA